jgi:hypothetical protein
MRTNIVGSKINLITHKDGAPRFNVMNQDTQISDEEILNILENAQPPGILASRRQQFSLFLRRPIAGLVVHQP